MSSRVVKLILMAILLVALAIRLVFLLDNRFVIDADEAIVGLMAKHIAEGKEFPLFYYGQHYMGALEAYFAALLFSLIGTTPLALQLVPMVCSLIVVVLLFFLGRAIAGERAGLFSAAFAAIPPPAFLIWNLKARGGFIEVLLLGVVALLLAQRWLSSESHRPRLVALLGFVCGIGWWVNNQMLYFMAAIAVSAVIFHTKLFFNAAVGEQRSVSTMLCRSITVGMVGLVGFFLGGAGFWFYNITNGFPSFSMFQSVDSARFAQQLKGVFSQALPALMGARRFWHTNEVFGGATVFAASIMIGLLVCVFWVRKHKTFLSQRGKALLDTIILLFLSCCIIFAKSSYGWFVSAPRYLLPIYVAIFVLLGVCVHYLMARRRSVGALCAISLFAFNCACLFLGGKAIPGQPLVFGRGRVPVSNEEAIKELVKRGIKEVRASYWVGYRLAFESQERVTFRMIGSPYQIRIKEYERASDKDLVPILLVKREAAVVVPALSRLGYSFNQERLGGYVLVSGIKPVFGAAHRLKSIAMKATSNLDTPLSPDLAVDGSDETRWGTGEPQRRGQELSIDFEEPLALSGITICNGRWREDYPRSLSVQVVLSSGDVIEVLSGRESEGVHFLNPRSDFTLRFEQQSVVGVRLVQNGSHDVFDWSVAEVELLGVE